MTPTSQTSFPKIAIPGPRIDPKIHVEPGTGTAFALAVALTVLGMLVAIVATWGIFLAVPLVYLVIGHYLQKKARALIHGSGVHVQPNQFPEIHACVETFKERLDLHTDIDVYIVEANVANAVVVKYGKRNVILLTDDLIQGCLLSGDPRSLSYVIAHELAHVSLNHSGLFRRTLSSRLKKLSRLDEHSADSVALALVSDGGIALKGMLLLTVGYSLLPYLNEQSILEQAAEVSSDKYSKKAERGLTHPLLLNRIHRISK